MEENSKMKTLSNDLIRRLLNTQEGLDKRESEEVIDKYGKKLLNSGYRKEKVVSILLAGIRGYRSKVRRCREKGVPLFRTAAESLRGRQFKRLVGSKEWYKKRKSDNSQEGVPRRGRKPPGRKEESQEQQARSVLFVEYSKE